MTYSGCPECFAKVQDSQARTMAGMVECLKCKKIVLPIYCYFFRVQVYDATGTIEVGFARQFAVDLLQGVEPKDVRRLFHSRQGQFDEFCNDKVLNQSVKLTVKRRTELFQGQSIERYYAFGAEYTSDEASISSSQLLTILQK